MVFPNSNLPSGAQPWVRDVQKRVETIEKNVKANEINGTSRDVQLEASFKRLDTAINGLIAADASIQTALANAQQGIDDAADAAFAASNAANAAQGAINSITNLSVPGAGTTVNATNIIGGTLKTATSGRHTEITATQVNFFDADSNYSGHISAAADGRAATVEMMNITGTGVIAYNGGTDLYGPGCSISAGNSGNGNNQLNGPTAMNSTLSVSGLLTASSGVTVSAGGINVTGNVVSSGSLNSTGQLVCSGGTFNASALIVDTGIMRCVDTRTRSTTGGLAMFVAANGTYHVGSSSRRFKQDILDYSVDYEAFLKMRPVTFRYKQEVEEVGEEAGTTVGFIAEELEDLGLEEYVVFDEEGLPFGIQYGNMVVGLQGIVAKQDQMIKALEARIAALESKV